MDDFETQLLATLATVNETMKELRADLKRREKRDLEAAERIPVRPESAPAAAARAAFGGPTFPNYGRSKNQPISGATAGDLTFYANGCLRSLADPGKARFHATERRLLDALNAELERQGGRTVQPEPEAPSGHEYVPPVGPGVDDDIPF